MHSKFFSALLGWNPFEIVQFSVQNTQVCHAILILCVLHLHFLLFKAYESKVSAMLQDHSRRQAEELAKLKREMREGFAAVHESISNMKQVNICLLFLR
jgi:hypothetical protein